MALPTKTDLCTLDIVYLGQPFVNVEAKPLSTQTLDIVYQAQPFVGAVDAQPPFTSKLIYAKVNTVWKNVNSIYFRISGVWKTVNNVYVNSSGVWKNSWTTNT